MNMIEESVIKQIWTSNFSVLLSLTGTACLLWLVKLYWERRQFYKNASFIPNRVGWLKFDLGLNFIGKSIDDSFSQIMEYFRLSPEIFKFRIGYALLIGVSKPEHMEIVLNNAFGMNKSQFVDFTKVYMGEGLFSAPVNIWKKHRKLINPSFNQKILNEFIPIFAEKCDILIGILEKTVGQHDIDIMGKLSDCTLDSICESAMGLRVEAQTTSNRYGEILQTLLEIATVRIFNIFYHSQTLFDMSSKGKLMKNLVSEMNGFSEKVISKRKEIFKQKMEGEYIEDEDDCQIKTFLELLLEISYNGDHFTDQQLLDEVNTFIAAQKVYEEAIEVLGEDRYPTKFDLPKLKFTEMFIKETLRIFPIAPLLVRVLSGDIKVDDYIFPKNSIILLGIMNLHRNPKYWEDPLKFNPHRFQAEEWAKKHPYSHLPFSGGPRNCIGSRYAMMIMKLILSKIVRRFKIKTEYKSVEEVELKINLMMRPSKGFKLSLELRE